MRITRFRLSEKIIREFRVWQLRRRKAVGHVIGAIGVLVVVRS
jgi:hypothetical protein